MSVTIASGAPETPGYASSYYSTDSTTQLLSSQSPNPHGGRPASIAPSISSVLSDASTTTSPNHVQRGFSSRAAYLAALHEFAESKSYMEGPHTLKGFYGTKTMDHYKQKPGLMDERRARKAKQHREQERQRRLTLTDVPEENISREEVTRVASNGSQKASEPGEAPKEAKEGRLRRLGKVLTGRRATIS